MATVDELVETLQSEFREPESRTRARLRRVLASTLTAAIRANVIAQEVFSKYGDGAFGGEHVRVEWQRELNDLIARMNQIYRPELVPETAELEEFNKWGALDPEEYGAATYKSWEGLIARRDNDNPDGLGAGVVPDAALPASLIGRLAILDEHGQETVGFANYLKVMISDVRAIAYKVIDTADGAIDKGTQILKDNAESIIKWTLIGVGVVVAAGVAGLAYRAWSKGKGSALLLFFLAATATGCASWPAVGSTLADVIACGAPQVVALAAGGSPDYLAAAECHAEAVARRLGAAQPPDADTGRLVVDAAQFEADGNRAAARQLAAECEQRARVEP